MASVSDRGGPAEKPQRLQLQRSFKVPDQDHRHLLHSGSPLSTGGPSASGLCNGLTLDRSLSPRSRVGTETDFSRLASHDDLVEHYVLAATSTTLDDEASTLGATEKMTDSDAFQRAITAIILANTLAIGMEAVYISRDGLRGYFELVEMSFTFVYLVEINVRLWEHGTVAFLTGSKWAWNLFDLTTTVLGVVDAMLYIGVGHKASGASVARLFRVLRTMRMFNIFKVAVEIDYVVRMAVRAAIKLFVLVTLVIFVFSVVATTVFWDCAGADDDFGDLGRSMWALFRVMTLDGWVEITESTLECQPHMILFFTFFVFCTSICLNSLAPAIFVELQVKAREREKRKQDLEHRMKGFRREAFVIRKAFEASDQGRLGKVSVLEMRRALLDDDFARQLRGRGLGAESVLRNVDIGLYDLWERQVEEYGSEHNMKVTLHEVLQGVLRIQDDVTHTTLWRCAMATRLQLQDLRQAIRLEIRDAVRDARREGPGTREPAACADLLSDHNPVERAPPASAKGDTVWIAAAGALAGVEGVAADAATEGGSARAQASAGLEACPMFATPSLVQPQVATRVCALGRSESAALFGGLASKCSSLAGDPAAPRLESAGADTCRAGHTATSWGTCRSMNPATPGASAFSCRG